MCIFFATLLLIVCGQFFVGRGRGGGHEKHLNLNNKGDPLKRNN
jgi:hypothetical protein